MKQRCVNPHDKGYPNYGARGIKVCKRWLEFETFLEDMGPGKKGWTIERVNNNKGYYPSNTVWATRLHQGRNKRNNKTFTVRGKTACLADLCEHFNVHYQATFMRLYRGWSVDKAFFAPKFWRKTKT